MTAQLKEMDKLVTILRARVDKQEPAIDFGVKRGIYSAKAFRFGCKLLNCKLTCQSAADVCEVVWAELFPGYTGRLPSREQFEVWRKQLYVWCRFAVLGTLQNKCDVVHLTDDATTKGKSVASWKTQIHLTGLTSPPPFSPSPPHNTNIYY